MLLDNMHMAQLAIFCFHRSEVFIQFFFRIEEGNTTLSAPHDF